MEEDVVGDGGEGFLVLIAVLEGVLINPVFLVFGVGRVLGALCDRSARRFVRLPVSFLAVFVVVPDRSATGTLQEADFHTRAGCAAAAAGFRHAEMLGCGN